MVKPGRGDYAVADVNTPVANTLHSCHADIMNKLNFNLLYPHLNQAHILPAEAVPNFMQPRLPESTGAQINNLIIWLHHCSQEQFSQFIALLRETAPEGGDAHWELAQALEQAFERFKTASSGEGGREVREREGGRERGREGGGEGGREREGGREEREEREGGLPYY